MIENEINTGVHANLKVPKSPLRIILLLDILVLLVACAKLTQSYIHNKTSAQMLAKFDSMNDDEHDILLKVEAMVHAAQMASYSGQLSWENTYYQQLEKLDSILNKYSSIKTVKEIIVAKNNLLKLDEAIFDLVRHGNLKGALQNTFSLEHEKSLYQFKLASEKFSKEFDQSIDDEVKGFESSYKFSVMFVLALVVLLVFSFSVQYLLYKSWMTKVSIVNSQLDKIVEQRTKDLNEERLKNLNSARLASLGEMAAGVAHEINNPLTVISGKAIIMINSLKRGDVKSEEFFAAAEKIQQMVTRITKIIHGMKTFSRDATNDPLVRTSLRQLIDDAQSICQERLKNHGVKLSVSNIPEELSIECRSSEIGQVLINLINNAHDAVQNLPEKWVEVKVSTVGNNVEIAVTDSGSGIPADLISKIMDPFFTTKEVGKGTGLGLSISKRIIDSHRGELKVDVTSKHTRFVIVLPISKGVEQKRAA